MSLNMSERTNWLGVVRSVRTHSGDLLAVFGLVVALNLVHVTPGVQDVTVAGIQVRTLLALPAALFAPGYVLVSALFPTDSDVVARSTPGETDPLTQGFVGRQIDDVERLALSFGTSVAIMPILAVGLGTVWTFSPTSVLTTLSLFLVLGCGIAVVRRHRVPEDRRYALQIHGIPGRPSTGTEPTTGLDVVLNVALAAAMIAALAAVGYAVATPYQGDDSATLYLATENGSGQLAASDYPSSFRIGEPQPLVVGTKHEGADQQYTVVLALERVTRSDGGLRVTRREILRRFHPAFGGDGNWTRRHNVTPTFAGENLRLHYYLYRGQMSSDQPTVASAYHDVYVWIDVEMPETEASGDG